jgi:hypothetical protein
MKSKKFMFVAIAITILLSVPVLAIGGSKGYLVPVTVKKADRSEIKGYIVLSPKEIQRLGSWVSGSASRRVDRRMRLWPAQELRKNAPRLLSFDRIMFTEGGYELRISYGRGKKPVDVNNFFTENGIRFTTDASHPDILPGVLASGEVLWIRRTGDPREIR